MRYPLLSVICVRCGYCCHSALRAILREQNALIADAPALAIDERLREREFGILDRLTRVGVEQFYPQQAESFRTLGKFYHRPPGGESWCDVILRLRSLLDTLSLHYSRQQVLIVTHEVVIMCMPAHSDKAMRYGTLTHASH